MTGDRRWGKVGLVLAIKTHTQHSASVKQHSKETTKRLKAKINAAPLAQFTELQGDISPVDTATKVCWRAIDPAGPR